MTAVPGSSSAAATGAPLPLAAELCWHASEACRAVDQGLEALREALGQATAHTDAITAIALRLADVPGPATPPCPEVLP